MRRFLLTLSIGFFIAVISCSANNTGSFSSLDQEALNLANREYFSKVIVHCGDFYYSKESGQQYFRTKNKFKVEIKSEPLSEADRLNGYEWRGEITNIAKGPHQELFYGRYGGKGEWSDGPVHVSIRVQKMNGQWTLDNLDFRASGGNMNQATCEQLHVQ